MIFSNTVSTVPTIVKCAWSGSEAGIVDVSGSTAELFLQDGTLATPGANSGQQSSTLMRLEPSATAPTWRPGSTG